MSKALWCAMVVIGCGGTGVVRPTVEQATTLDSPCADLGGAWADTHGDTLMLTTEGDVVNYRLKERWERLNGGTVMFSGKLTVWADRANNSRCNYDIYNRMPPSDQRPGMTQTRRWPYLYWAGKFYRIDENTIDIFGERYGRVKGGAL